MAPIDPQRIRDFLSNPELLGIAYMLIWGDLQEGAPAHTALTAVLFEMEAGGDPSNAPNRDLSEPQVRARVVDCVFAYPEIRAAAEKLMCEIDPHSRPWWKFW